MDYKCNIKNISTHTKKQKKKKKHLDILNGNHNNLEYESKLLSLNNDMNAIHLEKEKGRKTQVLCRSLH